MSGRSEDSTARYDGLADWYDESLAGFTLAATDVLDYPARVALRVRR